MKTNTLKVMEERACVPDHIFEQHKQPREQLHLDFLFNTPANVPTVVHVFWDLRQRVLQNSELHKYWVKGILVPGSHIQQNPMGENDGWDPEA